MASRVEVLWVSLAISVVAVQTVCTLLPNRHNYNADNSNNEHHNNGQDKAAAIDQLAMAVTHHHHPGQEFIKHSRLERSPQPQTVSSATLASVCDGLCNCSKENEIFINIVCDFTQNAVSIQSKLPIPIHRLLFLVIGQTNYLIPIGSFARVPSSVAQSACRRHDSSRETVYRLERHHPENL